MDSARLDSNKCQRFCLLLWDSGIIGTCFHSQLSVTWILGIWTQVSILVWQVLFWLIHLLGPRAPFLIDSMTSLKYQAEDKPLSIMSHQNAVQMKAMVWWFGWVPSWWLCLGQFRRCGPRGGGISWGHALSVCSLTPCLVCFFDFVFVL